MRLTCLTAGIAILAVAGIWQTGVGQEPGAKKGRTDATGLRERGDYLVNAAILCGDCHTPQDDRGTPDKSRHLQGTSLPVRPKKETKNWADESPDITSKGLAGKWSEEQMIKFLSTGIDPDGKKAQVPMPAFRLNAGDARAVAVYLKSLGGPSSGREAGKKKGPE
jgi:mono/diheme cytochrome c family protein